MKNINWQRWYFCLVLAVSVISIGLLVGQVFLVQRPAAQAGFLDLREWPLQDDRIVRLNGEWEFYYGRLLWPENFPAAESLRSLQQVPGAWKDYRDVVPQGSSEFTAATYRLRLRLPERTLRYGIKCTSIHANARIFVNGEEVLRVGNPGLSRSSSRLRYLPETGYFEAAGPELELIVQASAKTGITSGITQPIFFGSEVAIKHYQLLHIMRDTASAMAMVMIFIYLLATSIRTKNKRAHLLAAAFSFFTGLKALTQSELLLLRLFPSLPYQPFLVLGGIIMVVQLYLLLKYVHAVFNVAPLYGQIHLMDLVAVAMFSLGVSLLLLSPHHLEIFFLSLQAGAMLWILSLFLRYKQPIPHGGPLLGASICCMVAVVISNAFTLVFEPNGWALLLEVLLLLSLVLYEANEHSHTFRYAQQLNRQLISTSKLKDSFLAEVSHELRMPLYGITNISYSLLSNALDELSRAQTEDIALIHNISKRLALVVHSLIDHTRLAHDDLQLNLAGLDIHGAVTYTVDIFRQVTRGRNLVIENQIPENCHFVMADGDRLQQILASILDNAIKYTTEGKITISCWESEQDVYVSVTDTGRRMELQDLATVFKPYTERIPFDETDSYNGLRMQIARQLLELQGGQFTVQSALNQGSVIIFTLPRAGYAAKGDAAQAAVSLTQEPPESLPYLDQRPADGSQGKHLILSVDDEYSNLKALSNILTQDGYRVVSVTSARQALSMLEGPLTFDLCITDSMMPTMSGVELCHSIRKRYAPLDLPVLFLTAHARVEDIEAAFQAGANDFLGKPYETQELLARVNSLVHMRKAKEVLLAKETAFLQAQIKPHFLFNALNTIISFCYSDPHLAGELLTDLSSFLRYNVDFKSTVSFVPVEDELHLVEAYVSIEQARFGDRLQVQLDIDPRCYPFSIPPLTLQPLVENAIRHGVNEKKDDWLILLEVTYQETDNTILVTVTDNGVGIEEQVMAELMRSGVAASGVGLENINQRLQLLCGSRLRIKSEVGRGTQVSFVIPAVQAEAN